MGIGGKLLLAVAAGAMLSGCGGGGGGGGGVGSTPPPPPAPPPPSPPPPSPPPPPPANTTLTDLNYSQNFTNDAVVGRASIDVGTTTTSAASAQNTAVTVSYDAATKSYTVQAPSGTQTFSPADAAPRGDDWYTEYAKVSGSTEDYLSLTNPASKVANTYQYVGSGFWQHNIRSGQYIDITFNAFTYGFDTPAAAMPRTGSAGYSVDFFGFFTPLGATPKALSGTGEFRADFLTGNFATQGTAYEGEVIGDYYTGTHAWRAAGLISASNGTFSGNFAYEGANRVTVSGDLNGRFYGPGAEELGATFAAGNPQGAVLTGTIVGERNQAVAPTNLTLTNLAHSQQIYSFQAPIAYTIMADGGIGEPFGSDMSQNGRIDYTPGGTYKINTQLSGGSLPTPSFGPADKVASRSNDRFTVYEKVVDGQTFTLTLYNPGAANTELALTYTSFGIWERRSPQDSSTRVDLNYFVFGLPTQTETLGRSGSAHYAGLVYGTGISAGRSAVYNVSGQSSMDVDFATMRYDGSLTTFGTHVSNGSILDFGTLTFGGEMYNTYGFYSFLFDRPGHAPGAIGGRLYGPNGEEMGASFEFYTKNADGWPDTVVRGVTIATRQ